MFIITLSFVGCDGVTNGDVGLEPEFLTLTLEVVDREDNSPAENAKLNLVDEEGETLTGNTDSNGRFTFEDVLLKENESYEIEITHDDYYKIKTTIIAEDGAVINTYLSNSLIVGLGASPSSFHPLIEVDRTSISAINLINEPLFVYDYDLSIKPHLAIGYDINDSGDRITINLREDVKWHNGEVLTASDVAYTYNWLRENPEGSANSGLFEDVDNIEIVNNYKLEFHLDKPNVFLVNNMARVSIIPKAYHEEVGSSYFKENPIGTGPYILDNIKDEANYLLTANNAYWGNEPAISELSLKVITEDAGRLEAIETGKIDMYYGGVLTSQINRLKSSDQIDLHQTTGVGYNYVGFNNNKMTDLNLRKAISHLVDRDMIVNSYLDGVGEPGKSNLMPDSLWFNDTLNYIKYDRETAKSYMNDVNDIPEEIRIFTNDRPIRVNIAENLKDELVKLDTDLDVTVEVRSWEEYLDIIYDSDDYEIFVLGWGGQMDPDRASYRQFHSDGSANLINFSDARMNELLEKGRRVDPNSQESIDIYHEVQEILHEQQPKIFVNYSESIAVTRSNIEGFKIHPHAGNAWLSINDVEYKK